MPDAENGHGFIREISTILKIHYVLENTKGVLAYVRFVTADLTNCQCIIPSAQLQFLFSLSRITQTNVVWWSKLLFLSLIDHFLLTHHAICC